jgi:hypothetical protein
MPLADEATQIVQPSSSPEVPLAALATHLRSTIHSDSVVPDSEELAGTQRDEEGLYTNHPPKGPSMVLSSRNDEQQQDLPETSYETFPIGPPQKLAAVSSPPSEIPPSAPPHDDEQDFTETNYETVPVGPPAPTKRSAVSIADATAGPSKPKQVSKSTRRTSAASKGARLAGRKRKISEAASEKDKRTRARSLAVRQARKTSSPFAHDDSLSRSVSLAAASDPSPQTPGEEAQTGEEDDLSSDSIVRVLAYWREDHCFYPGTIKSVTAGGDFEVVFDDTFTRYLSPRDLRVCRLRRGDVVVFTGEMSESQGKRLEGLQRVVRVERGLSGQDADGPLFRDDVVVTLPADLDEAHEEGVTKGRILLEAVKVPTRPKRVVGRTLDDRKLTAKRISAIEELFAEKEHVSGPDDTRKARRAASPPPVRFRKGSSRPVTPAAPVSEGSNLFKGMSFLLTYHGAPPGNSNMPKRSRSSSSSHATTKEEMIRVIRAHGGLVVDDFESLVSISPSGGGIVFHQSPERDSTILLLADKPLRTLKYLGSLALGLPCVSTRWVELCAKQNVRLDWKRFMIPAGFSADLGTYAVGPQSGLAAEEAFDLGSVRRRHEGMQLLEGKTCLCVEGKGIGSKDVCSYFLFFGVWHMNSLADPPIFDSE